MALSGFNTFQPKAYKLLGIVLRISRSGNMDVVKVATRLHGHVIRLLVTLLEHGPRGLAMCNKWWNVIHDSVQAIPHEIQEGKRHCAKVTQPNQVLDACPTSSRYVDTHDFFVAASISAAFADLFENNIIQLVRCRFGHVTQAGVA